MASRTLAENSRYCANKLFKAGIRTNNLEGAPRLCMPSAVAGLADITNLLASMTSSFLTCLP